MDIRLVTENNIDILFNLAQAYEAEFSAITRKMPNKQGFFLLDTIPDDSHVGYLLYEKELPVGFCIADVNSAISDIAEFYIVPCLRLQNLGMRFAHAIFDKYPGAWQVRQIEGAVSACHFWRKVISFYTNNNFTQEVVKDPKWGIVTRQSFCTK